jgi:aspartyl-tRNA(Asn)/glutamyl-tRNA(Gln) amidotransferase subunit C
MAKTVELSTKDIEHLAELANLQLNEEEIEKFKTQLTKTLAYVENLHELNVSDVSPTNHITNQKNVYFTDGTKCERMFTQEEALANAKETKNKLFVVKRIKGL